MRVNPQLSFDGRCSDALKFYEKCLGGKTTLKMTWGESPMGAKVEAAWKDKIIHASFVIDGQEIGLADAPPGYYEKPQGVTVALNIDAPAEAERVFKALSEKGTVSMPLQETFWARRFGMCVDQFGIPWMVNCGKPA